jgi:hypothetical protein
MGKDTAEPADAAVLRKPQANPAPNPSSKDQMSYPQPDAIISRLLAMATHRSSERPGGRHAAEKGDELAPPYRTNSG